MYSKRLSYIDEIKLELGDKWSMEDHKETSSVAQNNGCIYHVLWNL